MVFNLAMIFFRDNTKAQSIEEKNIELDFSESNLQFEELAQWCPTAFFFHKT